MRGKRDYHWRCECGGDHFLSVTWRDGGDELDIESELVVAGDFRTSWRNRLRQALRVIRHGLCDTRIGLVLDAAKAREIAAVLVDFSDDADPLADHGPVTSP